MTWGKRGLTGNVIVADIDPNPPAAGSYAGYEIASNYHGATALPAGAVTGSNTFGIEGQGQDTLNPRFGFAYLLPGGDSMVLRGGIGLYYATPEGQLNVQLSSEQPFGGFRSLIGTQNAGATEAMPFAPTPVLLSFTPYSPTTSQTLDSLAQNDPVTTCFGNVPNGVLRGPGQIDADISVLKSSRFDEHPLRD